MKALQVEEIVKPQILDGQHPLPAYWTEPCQLPFLVPPV
uniref:Uncharacterized protein n=1 Tax=Anguilla anguilla TaxID=7936 RepID=A0A0E9VGA7_ANGAN